MDRKGELDAGDILVTSADLDETEHPSEEELATLRKVSAPLPWVGVGMCLIEFAERASYYGSTGPFNNFSEMAHSSIGLS